LAYCVPLGIPHSRFLGWDEDDQDKALAYLRDVAQVCGGCGTRASEWATDQDAFVGWVTRCEGCKRIEEEREHLEGEKGAHVGLMPQAEAIRRMELGEGV